MTASTLKIYANLKGCVDLAKSAAVTVSAPWACQDKRRPKQLRRPFRYVTGARHGWEGLDKTSAPQLAFVTRGNVKRQGSSSRKKKHPQCLAFPNPDSWFIIYLWLTWEQIAPSAFMCRVTECRAPNTSRLIVGCRRREAGKDIWYPNAQVWQIPLRIRHKTAADYKQAVERGMGYSWVMHNNHVMWAEIIIYPFWAFTFHWWDNEMFDTSETRDEISRVGHTNIKVFR